MCAGLTALAVTWPGSILPDTFSVEARSVNAFFFFFWEKFSCGTKLSHNLALCTPIQSRIITHRVEN